MYTYRHTPSLHYALPILRSCIAFAAVDRVRGADRDRIDARSLGQPSSCNGIVDGDPAGLVHLARVHLDPDRQVSAHRRAHSANDLGHQPCAVLKRAAIIVSPPVGLGREKRRDAITMPRSEEHTTELQSLMRIS